MEFEEIYEATKTMVYNLALQYVQNIDDAQDITQEVFIAVYHKLNNFREEANIKTWIYRICINKSLDYIKAKKRKKRRGILASIFEFVSDSSKKELTNFNHPGVQLEHQEALKQIFSCINRLPENQKTVLLLIKIEHQSASEVAEIMKLSPKAVDSLLQRAKNNLLKEMNRAKEK